MAEFVSDFLSVRGFSIEHHEKSRGRPNVIATYGPSDPRKKIIIEGHLDTQGIHGMTVDPFEGAIVDGRMYGRGTCDMKGPMAAALINLTKERIDKLAAAGVQLQFIGAIGEETGNIGAYELVEKGIGADEILVLEPTDQHIVHAHKGVCWFEVEIMGVAAHGSNPGVGRSSIRGMSRLIESLHELTDALPQYNELLGRPTLNIGIIRGGTSINIVPERCIIECDRRVIPGEDINAYLNNVKELVARLVSEDVIASGDVRGIKEGVPFETTADSSLVKRLCKSCETNGVVSVTEGAAWYSDAGPFSRTCREVAVFGPGSIRQAHTADEYIEITELQKGEEIIRDFLTQTAEDRA